jgi:hypothetical protein
MLKPRARIAFARSEEAVREGTGHLQIGSETKRLILVAENFCADFATATRKLKGDLPQFTKDGSKRRKTLGGGRLNLFHVSREK